jgi:DNA-binding transcriptional LysR family regulator
MGMELRHLRYFVAVAEEAHFGRAARRLQIAQPPLSRQIQALEAELGFLLVDRSKRKVELTPAGKAMLTGARRVLEEVESAVREARRAATGETGRLVVGYPSSLAFSGLTELLRAFRARRPAVEIALRELPPQAQIAALADARIDVGFIRGPVDAPELVTECVRREPLVIALPLDHSLARRTARRAIALEELATEPFVSFPRERGPAFFDLLVGMCERAGFSPRIVQEAPQLDLLSLVAAGFGVAIVPASLREVRRTDLVLRPIAGAPHTELLLTRKAGRVIPALEDFLEVVRERMKRERVRTG